MKQKIFDDFQTVSCNECSHYWDSSCDGVSKGKKQPCNSFLATRSIVIPLQIKSLRTQIKWIYAIVVAELIFIVILGSMIF